MSSDEAWDVALDDHRVPEALLPLFFVVRETKAKERVWRAMQD